MKHIGWISALALALSTPGFGTTVVSDIFAAGSSGGATGWAAVTWTQTGTYSNVNIGANVATGNGTATGTAYLMNQLGAGTTAANEVTAPSAFSRSGNPGVNVMTSLFTNLTLGPGTYYLLIDPSAQLSWDVATTPVQTLDVGVTQGADLDLSGPIAAFSPASSSVASTSFSRIFSVTGNAGVSTGTPEPSTLGLLLLGLGALVRLRSRSFMPSR